MSILLATILAISAAGSETAPDSAVPAAEAIKPAPLRSGRELLDAAHAAMRRWFRVTDQEAETAARELLGIYREIQQDSRIAGSQREPLRLAVRARLDQLCTQINKRLGKEKAIATRSATVKSLAANKNPTSGIPANGAVLAQMGLPQGGGSGGAANGQNGNTNANSDNGQQLVDLIQNVISPKSWDVNGGSCSIYYWRQQHAIVVRATDDVHGQVSDALEQLNRASN